MVKPYVIEGVVVRCYNTLPIFRSPDFILDVRQHYFRCGAMLTG